MHTRGFPSNLSDRFTAPYLHILLADSAYQAYRDIIKTTQAKSRRYTERSIFIPATNIATSTLHLLKKEVDSFQKRNTFRNIEPDCLDYDQVVNRLEMLLAPGACPDRFEILWIDDFEKGTGWCAKASLEPHRWHHRLIRRNRRIKVQIFSVI